MSYPDKFEEARRFLRNIPNINCGGCAVAALAMYKVGKKLGMNIDIIYLYQDKDGYNTNSSFLSGKSKKLRGCTHAACVVDSTIIDCNEVVYMDDYVFSHILPESVIIKSIEYGPDWNPEFSRNKYLPTIERYIGQKIIRNSLSKKIKRKLCLLSSIYLSLVDCIIR